jgi:uncharacterized Rmd1/YagE family protein
MRERAPPGPFSLSHKSRRRGLSPIGVRPARAVRLRQTLRGNTFRGQYPPMSSTSFHARALQLAERIELKGLERSDQFSSNPLAFKVAGGGTVVLFRSGAAVFIGMNPLEEEGIIKGLEGRLIDPLAERETESAQIVLKADGEDLPLPNGTISLKNDAPERLLLLAEALATSVAFAYDERRITQAFDRVVPIASSLKRRKLLVGSQGDLVEQIGEALLIQQRLAGRVELADRPDVLWDHPELERLWVKLTDEYDLSPRARAVGQKLVVIRETADTMADLLSTRTSHRLEWYIIGLICLELLLGLFNQVFK